MTLLEYMNQNPFGTFLVIMAALSALTSIILALVKWMRHK